MVITGRNVFFFSVKTPWGGVRKVMNGKVDEGGLIKITPPPPSSSSLQERISRIPSRGYFSSANVPVHRSDARNIFAACFGGWRVHLRRKSGLFLKRGSFLNKYSLRNIWNPFSIVSSKESMYPIGVPPLLNATKGLFFFFIYPFSDVLSLIPKIEYFNYFEAIPKNSQEIFLLATIYVLKIIGYVIYLLNK